MRASYAVWALLSAIMLPFAAVTADGDPPPRLQPPASAEEIRIQSHGSQLNGLMYLPAGPGTHPLAIFLHGYPGNERNLDLAQAVRRAGYDALYIDYRGDFGTGGTFSHANSLEDVAATLAWARGTGPSAQYHFDPARIALIGHSFGGWLALMSAEHEPSSVCIAALAAWNLGWVGGRFESHADERADVLSYFRVTTDGTGGPVHADPEDLIREIADHADAWNYLSQANALRDRALLLVAATRDTPDENAARLEELAAAIRNKGGKPVRVLTFEDDHPFSSHRLALADTVIRWLRTDCAKTQTGGAASK